MYRTSANLRPLPDVHDFVISDCPAYQPTTNHDNVIYETLDDQLIPQPRSEVMNSNEQPSHDGVVEEYEVMTADEQTPDDSIEEYEVISGEPQPGVITNNMFTEHDGQYENITTETSIDSI